jgi:hypothetical protein
MRQQIRLVCRPGKAFNDSIMKRSPEEVASTIEGFANGTGNQWAWDDFTSIRITDPELEAIRQKVVALPVEFPPANPRDYCSEAGMEKMRQIARDLRSRSGSAASAG